MIRGSSVSKNTKAIGDASVANILAALVSIGKTILLPWGDKDRYDLVVDEQGTFIRIQCKTGQLVDDAYITAHIDSVTYNAGTKKKGTKRAAYTKADIDYFGIYCPQNRTIYFITVEEAPDHEIRLRIKPTQNDQKKNIRWARDYEFKGTFPE